MPKHACSIIPETANEYAGETFHSEEQAPKFAEIASKPYLSNAEVIDHEGNKHTEQAAIENLSTWLEEAKRSVKDPNIFQRVTELAADLRFIGSKELEKALEYFELELLKRLGAGEEIYLYSPYESRSSNYLTYLLLNSVMSKTDSDNKMLEKLHFTRNRYLKSRGPGSRVITFDDFAITGTKISGAIGNLDQDIQSNTDIEVEVWLIASPPNIQSITVPTISYYELQRSRGIGTVHVVGTHCTTDYGYEDIIRDACRSNVGLKPPIFYECKRPYETKYSIATGTTYVDPKLEEIKKRVDQNFLRD